ncbi:MAG: uroporphyrinogen decarboxylase [Deltaproteobacteria bacterium]|nr:uroporphyrinogen decarboxylase [Deltaproteobacteria bacterium]
MNSKERFLAACRRKPVDRPPVWLMRQAGRYLPEYRHIRENHDFLEMCKTPEIACEVSLQPWLRYKMDAVIVFSDILFVPEAMGQKLTFKKNEGPNLSPKIEKPADLKNLLKVDAKKAFSFVYDTIALLKSRLPADVPVIGFAGAPMTLAYYMTDEKIDEWIKEYPKEFHSLLDAISSVVGEYVYHQHQAGADVIQIFDTWAGNLAKEKFQEFALPYIKKSIDIGKKIVPYIVYSRKCKHILDDLAGCGADVISIDPNTSMDKAIKEIGDKVAIQGNIDPKTLLTTPGVVRQETSRLLSKIKGRTGHIINLGHGVLQTTPLECVEAFVETVKHAV